MEQAGSGFPTIMFFNDWLSRWRIYGPERIAVTDTVSGRSLSYRELDARACRLADWLRRQYRIKPGDRVACVGTNRLELIDLFFGCGKAGAVLVPLNFRLPVPALRELISDCRPTLVLMDGEHREQDVSGPDRETPMASLEDLTPLLDSAGEVAFQSHPADIGETAMILYTSGTTGCAKGALISWRQIHWNAVNTTIGLSLTGNDVSFLNTPLYHTGGWHVLFTPLMHLGGRVVLQGRFDADACNRLIGEEGVTILFGIPTTMRMMMDRPEFGTADFSSLRFAICGGEPCPEDVIRTYEEKGVPVRQGYGLTEAGPNCFSLPAEEAGRKAGSVGYPNFHVGTRLVKASGELAGIGEVGELQMSGPHLFSGYWSDPEGTGSVLREGWVSTGDLFRRDAEGFHYVVGRLKEMFISGGENVYPRQVERALEEHEAVVQAAVVGLPDEEWGETGFACLVFHPDGRPAPDDFRDWVRSRLAGFQCPRHFGVCTDLPLGPSGKVDKSVLTRRALARLSREGEKGSVQAADTGFIDLD